MQHTVNNKAAQLCLSLSSSMGPSPDVAIQGTEGGKKRCKQCHQELTTATDDDGSINMAPMWSAQ